MKLAIVLALALAGCATHPRQSVAALDQTSAKYSSTECVAARGAATAYDDKFGPRAGAGFALGFLLGPFGVPIAMALDGAKADERKALREGVERSCI